MDVDPEDIDEEDGPLLPELFVAGGFDEEAGIFWDAVAEEDTGDEDAG